MCCCYCCCYLCCLFFVGCCGLLWFGAECLSQLQVVLCWCIGLKTVVVLEWRLLFIVGLKLNWLDWNWTGWIEIELIDCWIKLTSNWIGWMVIDRCQSKLYPLGLGSGGFCTAVSQCDVFVVVVVIYCVVDDSCQLWIVDCPLSIICWLLLSVCLSCTLFYVDVLNWRLLLYWSEDCCSLLDWNWTGWFEIELVGLSWLIGN